MSSGEYTAKSFYDLVASGGKVRCEFSFTWTLKIPPTVRIFAFLWLKGKLLTHDVMERRGFICNRDCVLCQSHSLETALHLFFQCSYARTLWSTIAVLLGYRMVWVRDTVANTFCHSLKRCNGRTLKQKWSTYFLSACWTIWKERNSSIFEGKLRDPSVAAEKSVEEARLWMQFC